MKDKARLGCLLERLPPPAQVFPACFDVHIGLQSKILCAESLRVQFNKKERESSRHLSTKSKELVKVAGSDPDRAPQGTACR